VAAEPVAKEWVEANTGPRGAVRRAGEGAVTLGRVLAEVPDLLSQAERAAAGFAEMARDGLRLSPETVDAIAERGKRRGRLNTVALWLIAASLAVLAAGYAGWL